MITPRVDTETESRSILRPGRDAAPKLSGIFLSDGDLEPLAAFLRALNEDDN